MEIKLGGVITKLLPSGLSIHVKLSFQTLWNFTGRGGSAVQVTVVTLSTTDSVTFLVCEGYIHFPPDVLLPFFPDDKAAAAA